MTEKPSLLDSAANIAVIVSALVLLGLAADRLLPRRATPPRELAIELPSEPIDLRGAAALGSPDAGVGLLVFSDFECPFCARFAGEVMPILVDEFVSVGKVQLFFRHLPLPNHPRAEQAAIAGTCAARQNKFWELHDWMFADRANLDGPAIAAAVGTLGLNTKTFEACVADSEAEAQVAFDVRQAREFGLRSTPTAFIGLMGPSSTLLVKESVLGARDVAAFRSALDSVLSKAIR